MKVRDLNKNSVHYSVLPTDTWCSVSAHTVITAGLYSEEISRQLLISHLSSEYSHPQDETQRHEVAVMVAPSES